MTRARLRAWERALIRCALLAWPRASRREDADAIEATIEERRVARRPPLLPGTLDTILEALALVRSGLRLRRRAFGARHPSGPAGAIGHAARGLVRSPRWALLVAGVFALGFGASSAVFTLVDQIALRPLPYPDPDALIRIGASRENRPGPGTLSAPNFRDLSAEVEGLSSLAASTPSSIAVGGAGRPGQLLRGGWVSGEFFETLGREAQWGRTLADADDRREAPLVVVISNALRRSLFGDIDAVGRTLTIEGSPATVVGVMGDDFFPPEGVHMGGTELWLPLAHAPFPIAERGLAFLDVVGRVAPDVAEERLQAELDGVAAGLIDAHALHPRAFAGLIVRPLRSETLGQADTTLALLLGAVGLLLTIACLNVGSLVILRTIDRASSLRIRLGLGASRGRVVAEVATEVALLAAVGGGVGLLGAALAVDLVVRTAPIDLPRLAEVHLDARVAGIALATSILVGLLVGLIPALKLVSGRSGLQLGMHRRIASRRAGRAREALVLVQVSMGLALAIGAGLLTRSLGRMQALDPGYDPRGLSVATLRIDGIGGDDFDPSILTSLQNGAARLPGVVEASLTTGAPHVPGGMTGYVQPDGVDLDPERIDRASVEFHRVSPGHLRDLGLRLRAGRFFADGDNGEAPPVVIVSESLARSFWPAGTAVGRRLVLGGDGTFTPRTIIGIVDTPRFRGPSLRDEQHVWIPFTQLPLAPLDLMIRSTNGARPLGDLARFIERLGGAVTLRTFRSVPEAAARHLVEPVFFTALLGAFAALASLLAAVGLYGTLAHSVRARRREFGVRLALGADASALTRAVVVRGARITGIGILGGLALAGVGKGLLATRLFGVPATDATTWTLASLGLLAVGLLASWLPARRAGRVSPGSCLHPLRSLVVTLLLAGAITPTPTSAQSRALDRYAPVPWPTELRPRDGAFTVGPDTRIFVSHPDSAAVMGAAAVWVDRMRTASGYPLSTSPATDTGNRVAFLLDSTLDVAAGGYRLEVDETGIVLRAPTSTGLFHGAQTLRQLSPPALERGGLLPDGPRGGWTIPAVVIDDAPRFSWRGLHLDVARHFFDVAFVKRYLDLMAYFKFNRFHWHLTDDQGWRIAIEAYPRLTEVGAWRDATLIGHYGNRPHTFDGRRYGGFYTQDEIREVVAYAAERHITVIPEIEMPGHASAALAAYPEFGCGEGPVEVVQLWGVFDDIYCPREETFAFLETVLDEVMDLFPGPWIHIGGDEAPKVQWERSALAQEVMRSEGLADERALQSWFLRRIEEVLSGRGRRLIGWDEIVEGGLSPTATLMFWRDWNEDALSLAAGLGNEVVMTPNSTLYFDHYQADPEGEPLAIGGLTTLEDVYAYEPVPEAFAGLTDRILGAQANLWTEYIETPGKAEYMTYPRAVALAEVVWSERSARDWSSFRSRLPAILKRLDLLGVRYRRPDS